MRVALRALALAGVLALAASGVPALSAPAGSDSAPPHDPERVLVAFRPGTPAAERAAVHARHGGRVENRMEWLDLDVVRLPRGARPVEASARYERNPNVAYAHPNWEVRLLSQPNDRMWRDLWGLHNTGQRVSGSSTEGKNDADIDAPEGWDVAFGAGKFEPFGGTRVGILDTGIDPMHVDLQGKTKACASATAAIGVIVQDTCTDDNLHGTHVAGTVAAIANNGVGVAGTAPNAELAVFKALNAAGVGFFADLIAGIRWLRTTGAARIISMSLGAQRSSPSLDQELSEAAKAGVLLIAAAGNDGKEIKSYPAAHADVVSVAATNQKDEHATFSNCNDDVEIAAPGVDIWSTIPGGAYASLDGTSMATPHVSGVAAMVWWKNPTWSPGQVRSRVTGTANDLGPKGRDNCLGHGRVNLASALGGR